MKLKLFYGAPPPAKSVVSLIKEKTSIFLWRFLVFALPIFTARASYRPAVGRVRKTHPGIHGTVIPEWYETSLVYITSPNVKK